MKNKILISIIFLFISFFIIYQVAAQIQSGTSSTTSRFGGSLDCHQYFEGKFYSCKDPILRLTYPTEDSYVTNVIDLYAGVRSLIFDLSKIQYTAFEFSQDGIDWKLIENITDVGLGGWETYWDTSSLPSGQYFVRGILIDGDGVLWHDVINLNVNKAPINNMTIGIDADNLILDGRNSFDIDGQIINYTWLIDIDNPFEVHGPLVFVPLSSLPIDQDFGIMFTTVDNNYYGGSVTHIIGRLPPDGGVQASKKSCGCVNMTLKSEGTSFHKAVYLDPPDNKKLGPISNLDKRATGPFNFLYRFEIEAELVSLSNPQECWEGQRIQSSYKYGNINYIHSDKISTLNPDGSYQLGANDVCPVGGANWCDDDYHEPQPNKKSHINQSRMIWTDAPHFVIKEGTGAKRADILNGGIEINTLFEAWVKGKDEGALGCKCTWKVHQKVERNITSQTGDWISENNLLNLNCDNF